LTEKRCLTQHLQGQLLVITHRTVEVKFEHFEQRFSPRKLIPVNPKTTGDYLLLKRIEANLSQPEVALKAGVTERTIRAWEHDQLLPTQSHPTNSILRMMVQRIQARKNCKLVYGRVTR
jgi:DNA-binding transcriptional regulator YiaG